MSNYYIKNGELYHYGVIGMKWGVRRYQNADGTLTAAGKRRYDKIDRKESDRTAAIKRIDNQTKKFNKRLDKAAAWDKLDYDYTEMLAKSKYDKAVSKAQSKYDAESKRLREAKIFRNALSNSEKEMVNIRYDYAVARRKAKIDKRYKNSKEYKNIKSKYTRYIIDKTIYGSEGPVMIGTLKQAGYTEKGARFMTAFSGSYATTAEQFKRGSRYNKLERNLVSPEPPRKPRFAKY